MGLDFLDTRYIAQKNVTIRTRCFFKVTRYSVYRYERRDALLWILPDVLHRSAASVIFEKKMAAHILTFFS